MSSNVHHHKVPVPVPKYRRKSKGKRRIVGVEVFNFDADDLLEHDLAAQFATTSADGRRHYRQTEDIAPPTPLPESPGGFNEAQNDFDADSLVPGFIDLLEKEVRAENAAKPRARRYVSSDQPLTEWVPFRDEYLDELIHLEGRGQYTADHCPSCSHHSLLSAVDSLLQKPATVRCKDCFGGVLLCNECCVRDHAQNPLHVIEKWNGTYFEPTTLADIGLRVQLGHPLGKPCSNPRRGYHEFTVIHTNGLHHVKIDYCECDHVGEYGSHRQQLLRRQWYPATHTEPQTCATFAVLTHFHMQNLQGKVAGYDYFSALEKLTDNAGMSKIKDRYKEFMRIMREWQHLKMLKRAGRGHTISGSKGTQPGELGVICPACPHPGINLPPNWKDAPDDIKFLYILFLAIDACFRLKRRLVSSEKKDPGLGTGLASFVEDTGFRKYILTVTDQKEMSSCTGLSALDHANSKFSAGYATTGAGICCCARHEFIERGGVADLQKGERYANMDYVFASALKHHDRELRKVVSYDIACQWWINLFERLEKLPLHIRPPPLGSTDAVIPKLHVYSHKLQCQTDYSLNYLPGAGRTDGEGIERTHSNTGPVCASTKQMGPGYRHDSLDWHWCHWNWQKIVGLGTSLHKKLKVALVQEKEHEQLFRRFSELQLDDVPDWLAMVTTWEKDRTKPNPYVVIKSGVTEADVKLLLAEEEAELAAQGVVALNEVNASAFVVAGLDLQDRQRKIEFEVKYTNIWTPTQKTDLLDQRTRLNREVTRFRSLQDTYMPTVAAIANSHSHTTTSPPNAAKRKRLEQELGDDNDVASKPDPVELQTLFLPSEIPAQALRGCHPGLDCAERKLRDAQCRTSLDNIRTHLYMKSGLMTYKQRHVRHQGASTRTRTTIDANDMKIKIYQSRYNTARKALIALGADPENMEWREVKDADLRCLEDPEQDAKREMWARNRLERQKQNQESRLEIPGPGEGHRILSWIWEGAGRDPDSSTGLHEALRVEWAKSRARALRWREEVLLLKEEMRRVIVYFEYKASWWVERNNAEGREASPALAEGLYAYAAGQAQLQRDLASTFSKKWAPVLAGEVGNEDAEGVESDDELDGAGAGSEEEAMEEADEEDEGITDEEFTGDD